MCGKNVLLFLILVFGLRSTQVFSDVPQYDLEQRLTNLSLNIQRQLKEARLRSESLSESLTELRQDLTLSNEQRDYYRAISTGLESSLQSTIQSFESISLELNQTRRDLAVEKAKVRTRNRILLILGIIGGVLILGKIAFKLYAKRVPVPR